MNKIYCTIPWTEVHNNADGTYHTCGAQPNTVTGTEFGNTHNVFNMTISEWMDSQYQAGNRQDKLDSISSTLCNMCYREEEVGKSSKRERELHKYPVLPLEYKQVAITCAPTSYHISFGNECNLSCVMCSPWFSSKIAAEEKKLGTWTLPVKLNWTYNEAAWNMVVSTICDTKELQAVHIIGGEPLINNKFEQLVDALISAGRTNIYLGFTTNGTIFNRALLEKLNIFRHVDIGVSIETAGVLNDYIREGSKVNQVLDNIKLYLKYRKQGHVYVTLRVVPSALSVHTIDELFLWCIDNQLDIMSNLLVRPNYMAINNLPAGIKEKLLTKFSSWQYSTIDTTGTNPRDPTYFREHIDNELKAIIKMLQKPNDPILTEQLYKFLKDKGWFKDPVIAKYFEVSDL
jgi:pyruvate-formate lyase-activating enzyme